MIYIKVKDNHKRFIAKCLNNNINLYDIKYNKDFLIVLVDDKDLDTIKEKNYYSKISIIKYKGLKRVLINIKMYLFDYLMILFLIIALYFISNVVIDIDILHENKVLIERVREILEIKGVNKFQIGKTLHDLNKISDEILSENRDILDWISIDKKGMKYIVSFEERILTEEISDPPYCDIVAKRDGVINKIVASSGVTLVEKSMYVKKGDVLISGTIKNNEEIKDTTCAKGDVYAEVWYKINISVPLNYEEKEYTNKYRYNFILNGNYLFKKKYEHYDEAKVFSLGPFKIVKELEYQEAIRKHGIEEAKTEGIELAKKRLLSSLDKNSQVLSEKVLNSELNNSKIELEVFISAYENIGVRVLEYVGDVNDTE